MKAIQLTLVAVLLLAFSSLGAGNNDPPSKGSDAKHYDDQVRPFLARSPGQSNMPAGNFAPTGALQ